MDARQVWLKRLELERYGETFADSDVDFRALRLLTESDLEKLDVSLTTESYC